MSKLIKDSSKHFLGNMVLKISQLIQGLIIANILGPTIYGVKNTLQLFEQYGQKLHLGALDVFFIKRQELGESNKNKAISLSDIVFSNLLFTAIFVFLISVMLLLLLPYSIVIRISLLFISLIIFIEMLIIFYQIIFRAQMNYTMLATSNILRGVISLVLIISLTYFFGLIGFFIASFLSCLIVFFYLFNNSSYRPTIIFKYKSYFNLIKRGIIFLIINLSYLIVFSIGRLFIIKYFGATELGYYAIGLFFSSLVLFLLQTVFDPIYPRLLQNINNNSILKYIIKPNLIIYSILFYFTIMVVFLSGFLIFILPAYQSGLFYINILIFSTIFMPHLIGIYMRGIGREKIQLFLLIITVLLSIILNFVVLYLKLSPKYIAIMTLIILFFYGNTLNLIGYKYMLGSWKLALREIFNYLWPLGYALIGYGLLWILAHFWLYGFMNYYVVKIIQALLFTIWYSPILWKIEKEHKILKIIWQGIKNKFSKQDLEKIE